jgi:hypothetical protein
MIRVHRILACVGCALTLATSTVACARAQTESEVVAAVEAALPRALDLARFQTPDVDTLTAFRRVDGSALTDGLKYLVAAAPRSAMNVADEPPVCGWSDRRDGPRGMGVHISDPEVSEKSVSFTLDLMCREGESMFGWTFRFVMLRTERGWILRELTEISIS